MFFFRLLLLLLFSVDMKESRSRILITNKEKKTTTELKKNSLQSRSPTAGYFFLCPFLSDRNILCLVMMTGDGGGGGGDVICLFSKIYRTSSVPIMVVKA